MRHLMILLCLSILFSTNAFGEKTITGKVKSAPSGSTISYTTSSGSYSSELDTKGKFSITGIPNDSKTGSLSLIGSGKVIAYVYSHHCTDNSETGEATCNKSKYRTTFKSGAKNLSITYKASGGIALAKFGTAKIQKSRMSKTTILKSTAATSKNFGLPAEVSAQNINVKAKTSFDSDGDGAPDALDLDHDNDKILNPYDPDFSLPLTSFKVFSNLKLNLEQSLNASTSTITQAQIDSAMQTYETLAIEVLAGSGQTSELNCRSLTYCNSGGTGTTVEGSNPFPGTAGGTYDADGDGKGEITKGPTNDFQLKTGATSSQIGSGDLLIQRVFSGTTPQAFGLGFLHFAFNTNPAVTSILVPASSTTYTVTYPVTSGSPGTDSNCFLIPATGDAILTITALRPQRPGIPASGEGTYMDIGNSTVVIDIPNGACSTSTSGPCTGTGPGTCRGSSVYSESDTNLSLNSSGELSDAFPDTAPSTSNTMTFTVNVTQCMGSISFPASEKLYLDLQMKNSYGDNAAQKFCIRRAAP